MNTTPDNNDLLRSNVDSVVYRNQEDRSASPTVSESSSLILLASCDKVDKNVKIIDTHSRGNWPGLALPNLFGLFSGLGTCPLEPEFSYIKPCHLACPLKSEALFMLYSNLNGSHGEYTGSDDVDDANRKRVKKEAENKKVFGKVGNSHKPINPSIITNNLCVEFLDFGQCVIPGCPFAHIAPVLCPNNGVCQALGCMHTHKIVEPVVVAPPVVLVSDIVDVVPQLRMVPTNRLDAMLTYSNSLTTRIVIFLFWTLIIVCIREFFSSANIESFGSPFGFLNDFCWWYFEKVRLVNTVLFVFTLQYSDEYVECIRHFRRGQYRRLYDMGPESLYSASVACIFVGSIYCDYPTLSPGVTYFSILFWFCITFKIWYSCSDYCDSTIEGDQIKEAHNRYDSESWSYKTGAIRCMNTLVIDELVDALMMEFVTSDCTLLSTFNRMLYSAVERSKLITQNGAAVNLDLLVSSVKLAQQRLKGYQLSFGQDGGLVKRLQTAPMA